ncbi:hypothetical protein ACFYOF_16930 [Streptomyces sp. NPDC007148]|uniref:hypothetical protein n=1 Tax=Streptomyces sp. NPDC007148 TaxID=3364775 RepID=UPI003678B0F3
MPHEYYCRSCNAVSPKRHERRSDAEDDGVEHRRTAHGGLAPDAGDGVRAVHTQARGDGILPSGWIWAVLFFLALVLANCWGR